MNEKAASHLAVSSLGEVLQKIEGGGTPSRSNESYWGNEIPWATVKDLKGLRLNKTEESITQIGLDNSSSRLIPKGSVIIATRMAVGKAVTFDRDVAINQDLKALYPKIGLNSEYLLQWFIYNEELIEGLSTGSTVKGIGLEVLKSLTFMHPSLPAQNKIVSILNSIDKVIETTRRQIDKLTQLKKATINEFLTEGIGHTRLQDCDTGAISKDWQIVKADKLCTKITKGTTPSKSSVSNLNGIPFIRVNNLGFDSELHFENGLIFVNSETHASTLSRSRIYPMDVLMNIVGPPLGKVALVPDRYPEYNTNQAVLIYRTDPKEVITEYFLQYLMSGAAQTWFRERAKRTSGQENLTIELAKELPVPLPIKSEQVKIANSLASIQQLIKVKKDRLNKTKSIKKSLMRDFLLGKVEMFEH